MKEFWAKHRWVRYVVYVIGTIVLLCVFFFVLPHFLPIVLNSYQNGKTDTAKSLLEWLGLMGDSFGIYNALFSALAFGGVLITLYHQNRNERKASLMDRFYKILDFQQSLINEMTVMPVRIEKTVNEVKPVSGRKVFVEYKIQLKYLMKAVSDISEENNWDMGALDIADIAYAVFYYGEQPHMEIFHEEISEGLP